MRFSGFTDEWKSFKLKDLLHNKSSSISINQLEDNVGNYPLYGASGFLKCIDFYEMDSDYISIVKDGSGVGNISFHEKNTSVVNTSEYILPKENLNIHFIFYLLQTINLDKYKTGSTIPHIYFKDYSIEKVKIPKYDEQKKIGILLKNLDAKIEILDNKLQMCQNFKKYLMQQIFTQKLRFADSDSCWKEISLKDIGTFYRGHSYNSTNVADEGLLVLRSNNIQGNVLDFSEDGLQFVDKDCKKELELQKNDIVICMSNGTRRLVGKSAEYTGNYENKVTVGAFCSIFRTKNKLAKYLFQTESYKKNLYLILAGTNINNLKNSDLEKFKFNIPTNESEINKIHDLFVSIDNKIDYNKKQLEEITLFKKGLLQQMFVVRINWRCNFKLAKSPSFNKHLLILKNKIIFIIIE